MSLSELLQVGQVVAIQSGVNYREPYTFTTIKKITATQVTTADGSRYLLRNGDKVGSDSSWHSDRIAYNWTQYKLVDVEEAKEANQRWIKHVKKQAFADKMKKINFTKLTDEDFESVKNILEKYME